MSCSGRGRASHGASLYAVFVVGFGLIGFPWPVFVFMAVMFAVNYLWEVKTFQRVLRIVGDEIERSNTGQALGVERGA